MPASCAPLPTVSPICLLHLAADEPIHLHLFELHVIPATRPVPINIDVQIQSRLVRTLVLHLGLELCLGCLQAASKPLTD